MKTGVASAGFLFGLAACRTWDCPTAGAQVRQAARAGHGNCKREMATILEMEQHKHGN